MSINKRSLNEKFKILRLYIKYFSRNLLKKIKWKLPYALFILSIVLFLSIMIPNFVHRFPCITFSSFPRMLVLEGTIYSSNGNTTSNKITVPGVTIEVGGYNCKSDKDGKYILKFVSDEYENIPIILNYSMNSQNSKETVVRVSFNQTSFKKDEDFNIR